MMKRLILVLFGVITLTIMSFGQATPAADVRVANATTTFDVNISVGTKVYDVASDLWYTCTTASLSTLTLTTGSANFSVIGAAVTTGDLTEATSSVLTITGGTNAVVGSGTTIQVKDATTTTKGAASFTASDFNVTSGAVSIDYTNGQEATSGQDGFLSSTDWTTFNSKLGSEVDGSITNEGSLSVGAGAANTSLIVSNTSGSTDVTISGSTYLNVTESGSTITLTPTGLEPTVTKGNLTEATSNHLTLTGGTGAVIGSGTSIQVKTGITDNALLEVDDAAVASGQYAKFTANGIEAKTTSEVKSDLTVGTPITEKFEEDDGTATAHTLSNTPIVGEAGLLVQLNGYPLTTDQFVLSGTSLTIGIPVYTYDVVTVTYQY